MPHTEMMSSRKETKPVALTVGLARDISQLLENSKIKIHRNLLEGFGGNSRY